MRACFPRPWPCAVVFATVLFLFTGSVRSFRLAVPRSPSASTRYLDSRYSKSGLVGRDSSLNAQQQDPEPRQNNNPLDFLFNPYESKIPKEIESEIYTAEGNTETAKGRTQRVVMYACIAFIGVLGAFFNGFLSELRSTAPPDGEAAVDLAAAGFGWVSGNPVTSFLLLNKIGGGMLLLGGGAAGLLAEAEYDTRRINAEKIWEELQRRRAAKEKGQSPSKAAKKKRRDSKEAKRMSALSELIVDVKDQEERLAAAASNDDTEIPSNAPQVQSTEKSGVLGQLKSFYDKADEMAATQALLLNKELEDRGILEKITDESGLKIIGRQNATEGQQASSESDKKDSS